MSRDELITSAVRRLVKLGGLMGRVGVSMVGNQVLDFARSDVAKQVRRTELLVRNATRIVETLGQLKGAAMKVGQMLSLHVGLMPPEVAEVLRSLQQQAPDVPFEVMQYEIRGALKNYDELFERLEERPLAAASIGQVHRGWLRDGRRVAVKIQYPLIDEIIKADLQNLKRALRGLVALFVDIDFEPLWREVRDRLLEELDYTHEAANIRRMERLHAGVPEIVIPRVIDEATTKRVLTMEYREGISPDAACSERFDQTLRDRWARVLLEFVQRGLYEHRFLHADPNLANFAFTEDGRVIVYDFGCVKRIPRGLARGYARLALAAIEGRKADIPQILLELGVFKEGGAPLSTAVTDPYVDLFAEMFRETPPYTFGEDDRVYRELFDLGLENLPETRDIRFPRDLIFVNRTLAGHFGNLSRLRATGPWRDLVLRYVEPCAASPGG